MNVCQMLTGSGGWPLTIVMTPDKKPFFAATYIPRENAFGRIGMLELVPRIRDIWKNRNAEVLSSAEAITHELGKTAGELRDGAAVDGTTVSRAAEALVSAADPANGGFGGAPKFPMPPLFGLLLRAWKRDGNTAALGVAEKSLTAMRNGGIYDQLGFGFHRYSTDARWLVPHFEKMLYDQALLAIAYTEAWQATRSELYRRTAQEVLAYVRRDMTSAEGGFFSAEDADSEGEEGKFYLWSAAEARSVLGDEVYERIRVKYGLSDEGNFTSPGAANGGENILHRDPADGSAPAEAEAALLAAREKRVRPFKDDKVLSGWNGMMIAAFARAGAAFEDPALVRAGERAAAFVLGRMRGADGRLLHRYREGEAAIPAFADDYACLAWGLIELYEASFDPAWLREASGLMDTLISRYWDPAAGGFFLTADDAEPGIAGRQKPLVDGAVPSANSVALLDLLRLAGITENKTYASKAQEIMRLYPPGVAANPMGYGFFLSALDYAAGPSFEVVISGDPAREDTRDMLRAVRRRFLPNAVLVLRPTGAEPEIARIAPFTRQQTEVNGRATAYLCRSWACELPTNDLGKMLAGLGADGEGDR
jgi:uncharacterized protein YyaL (SSP411 family)